MWTDLRIVAAEAAGIDPTVAFATVIGAVVTLIGSVVGVLMTMSRHSDERVDNVTTKQFEDKDRRIQQLEGEVLAAEKDVDLWREKATKLATRVAVVEAENRRLKREG
jgi:hypothetical protein